MFHWLDRGKALALYVFVVFMLRLATLEVVSIFVGRDFPILFPSLTYIVLVFTSVLYLWNINISVCSGSKFLVLNKLTGSAVLRWHTPQGLNLPPDLFYMNDRR